MQNQPIGIPNWYPPWEERVTHCFLWRAGDSLPRARHLVLSALSSLRHFQMLRKDIGIKELCN